MAPKAPQAKAKVNTHRPGGSGVRAPPPAREPRPREVEAAPPAAPEPEPAAPAPRVLDAAALQDAELSLAAPAEARHRLRLRFAYAADQTEAALNYVLLLPKLRTHAHGHARCSDHGWRLEGTTLRGKPIQTFDFEHFVLANVPFSMIPNLVVEHVFTSHTVQLQFRDGEGCAPMPVPELPQADLLAALSDLPSRAEKIRGLLEDRGWARREGERDVAYAHRLGEALQQGFAQGAAAVEETDEWVHLLPTLMLERGRGDTRAFSAAFVYALRASGVPARMSLGLRFCPGDPDAAPATEAQSEFFAEDLGWVPADVGQPSFVRGPDAEGPRSHFVSWHSATPSRAEAKEVAQAMRAASEDMEGALLRIHKICERKGIKPGKSLRRSELAAVVGPALGLEDEAAERCVAEVLDFCKLSGNDGAAFTDGYAALTLGACPVHLATGKGACAAGFAGVALFEGGPYEDGVPLDIKALAETRLLLRSFRAPAAEGKPAEEQPAEDAVAAMERPAAEAPGVMTWRQPLDVRGKIWVDYEYEELPLAEN